MKMTFSFPVEKDMPMKKEPDGSMHPASDYLVVENPKEVSTWHLPVYDAQHCAAAHAALLSPGGSRGNKYEGPQKDEAIKKLKVAYAKLKMPWPK
jgi:hypothetical protein